MFKHCACAHTEKTNNTFEILTTVNRLVPGAMDAPPDSTIASNIGTKVRLLLNEHAPKVDSEKYKVFSSKLRCLRNKQNFNYCTAGKVNYCTAGKMIADDESAYTTFHRG